MTYRRLSLFVLGAALVAQAAWTVWRIMTIGFAFIDLWRPLAFSTAFLLVALTLVSRHAGPPLRPPSCC